MNRIILNVTLSAGWRRRAVGLVRVERELIKGLFAIAQDRLVPVVFDVISGQFRRLDSHAFETILKDDWILESNYENAITIDCNKYPLFLAANNDRFVSIGSDWSYDVVGLVAALYGDEKVLIPACYDLIPLVLPEFTPGPEFYDQFKIHYTKVHEIAHSVFSISEHTKKDLLNFWGKSEMTACPDVQVIPLAGMNVTAQLPELNAHDTQFLEASKLFGNYVIFVSTLEPRKNHQILLDIWRNLYEERGADCPHLLLVGMRGWGTIDLLDQLGRMAATKNGKISWHEGVSDALLAHLYAGCMFSVFPSIYEGWGLAATEALSHGKVCVISNNSALVEATYDLMPGYHPLDYVGWYGEITKLTDDSEYRGNWKRMWLRK